MDEQEDVSVLFNVVFPDDVREALGMRPTSKSMGEQVPDNARLVVVCMNDAAMGLFTAIINRLKNGTLDGALLLEDLDG